MENMNNKLTVFITGADRGLGYELVRVFISKGFYVFAGKYLSKWTMLDELEKENTENMCQVECDISSEESVVMAVKTIMAKTDHIDILINNAGIVGKKIDTIFSDIDLEEVERVISVNAIGSLRVTKHLINLVMNSFRKLIVNISSEAGSIGTCWRYDNFGYCMSKAAVNMTSALIHNSLHRELNGQVINIHPGGMASQIGQGAYPDQPQQNIGPVKRFLNAQESAQSIADLILDQERYKSDHPAFINYRGDKIPW